MPARNDWREGYRVVDALHLPACNFVESGRPFSACESRSPTRLRFFLYAAKGFPYSVRGG